MTEETVIGAEPASLAGKQMFTQLIDPQNEDFVRVTDYIPDAVIDLKYARQDNFTGQVIYAFDDAFLRYGTVMKLKAVMEELALQGLGIKIWDGFRPVSAQFKLWEICPDPNFVANPNQGYSNHSRGFAVDLTLVDRNGDELVMPTGFDDFSALADRDYSDCSAEAAANAILLERMMEKHGFQGYWGEWWHFNDTSHYEVEQIFDPGTICVGYLDEEAPLLKECRNPDSVLLTIPADAAVTVLGYHEEYTMVEFWGYRGYVIRSCLR